MNDNQHIVAPYCLDCGYDLVGSPSLRCSECGKDWSNYDYSLKPMDRASNEAGFRVMRAPAVFAGYCLVAVALSQVTPAMGVALLIVGGVLFVLSIPVAMVDATNAMIADQRLHLFRKRVPLDVWSSPDYYAKLIVLVFQQVFFAVIATIVCVHVGLVIGASVAELRKMVEAN